MIQNIKRGIAMLSVASAINLSAQTTYKARVINQDTGEPIIGAVVKGNKGVEAVTNEDGYFSLNTNDDQTHTSAILVQGQDMKGTSTKRTTYYQSYSWYRPSGGTGYSQYLQCT